ncbi:MAG: discoidin domain-containing protein [Nitrosopumilus sp.]|nr:discoidin domain-containing protein [Nitrosopumilus sp.]
MFVLGVAGLAFAAIKRDFLTLLWVIPYLVLVYAVGVNTHFHWALVLPAFCIAGAILIEDLSNRATAGIRNRRLQNVVPIAITCGIGVFGIVATFMLVTANLSTEQTKVVTSVTGYLNNNNTDITLISNSGYSWIPKYVFHQGEVFPDYRYAYSEPTVKTEKVILVADDDLKDYLSTADESEKEEIANFAQAVMDDDLESFWQPSESSKSLLLDLGNTTSICGINIAWFKEEEDVNPTELLNFFGADSGEATEGLINFTVYSSNDGRSFDEIYSHDINDSSTLPQKYDFKDTNARFLKITLNGNFNESTAGLSEISVYGEQMPTSSTPTSRCENIEISKVTSVSPNKSTNQIFADYNKFEDESTYSERLSLLYEDSNTINQFNGSSRDPINTYPYAEVDLPVEIRTNYRIN